MIKQNYRPCVIKLVIFKLNISSISLNVHTLAYILIRLKKIRPFPEETCRMIATVLPPHDDPLHERHADLVKLIENRGEITGYCVLYPQAITIFSAINRTLKLIS